MAVSYYQLMYSNIDSQYEIVRNTPNAAIYKLNRLCQSQYLCEFVLTTYNHSLCDFTSNMEELVEFPPLSKEYLSPEMLLSDLEVYTKLLKVLSTELESPQNQSLVSEMKNQNIDGEALNWINSEVTTLKEVCLFAQENGYVIKFACDY